MRYVAAVGLNYGKDDRRIEPGEPVPAALIREAPWLVERGLAVPEDDEAGETEVTADGD